MSSELSDGISRNSRESTIYSLFGYDNWGFCLNLCKYWVDSSLGWKWRFVGICTKTVHIQLWVEKWGFCLYLCKNCVYLCVSSFGLKVRSLFGCVQQLRAFLLWVWKPQFATICTKTLDGGKNCAYSSLGWKLGFAWICAKTMNILIWIERYNLFGFCAKSVHVLLQVEKEDLFGIYLSVIQFA